MIYHQPFQVVGFHSCDKEVGMKVLNGEMDLNPSENPWDWLGSGIYFWEQNPDRALEYANESAAGCHKQRYDKRLFSSPPHPHLQSSFEDRRLKHILQTVSLTRNDA